MNLKDFKWIREPKNYTLEQDTVKIVTSPYTDLWQRTYYHFRNDTAPVFQMETDDLFFTFTVKTHFFDSRQRYDQCGIVLYLDSENWFKACVEYENETFAHLGSVVTNGGYSDWATTEIPATVKTMWYRLSRRMDDYRIECSEDGITFRQMRICHMQKGDATVQFGIFACSAENGSFQAEFTDFHFGACVWNAHDGQQPDAQQQNLPVWQMADPNRYTTMEYRSCGASGLKLPAVSFGLWHNFGDHADFDSMVKMCTTAFDHGITHFDLANNYGPAAGAAERNFGKILKREFSAYRDEMIISTKAGYYMWPGPYGDFGSRKYLIASLDQSLLRMGLDYVDIFYHHRMDPNTPLEETMGALNQIVKSGKALYIGLSNYDGKTLKEASKILKELRCPFLINQNRYSILDRTIEKNGLLDACAEEKKGLILYSPLAQGMLTDRYLQGIPADSRVRTDGRFLKEQHLTKETLEKIKRLDCLAKERGQTLAQMALAWAYHHSEVTSVLVGASKPQQILDDIGMLQNTSFTAEELAKIDEIVLS